MERERKKEDAIRLAARRVFNVTLRAADGVPAIYWPAANYLLAYAILRDQGSETLCSAMHPDPRVVFAFRSGWVALEEERHERGEAVWPQLVLKMRRFHQGRITAGLAKEYAAIVRSELAHTLKLCGPASFGEMLDSALH